MNITNGNLEKMIKDLNNLCIKLHNKYYINYGGCCYVAFLIAKYLENFNIRYKLLIADSSFYNNKPSSIVSRRQIKSRDFESFVGNNTCGHYYLSIGNNIINATCNHGKRDTISIGWINSKDIYYLYNYGDWNDAFDVYDREKVRKAIYNLFKKYEESEE